MLGPCVHIKQADFFPASDNETAMFAAMVLCQRRLFQKGRQQYGVFLKGVPLASVLPKKIQGSHQQAADGCRSMMLNIRLAHGRSRLVLDYRLSCDGCF